jgi:hypothetical protein
MSDVGVTGVVVGRRPPEGGGEPVSGMTRFNVMDDGAKGDGSTDDAAAIQKTVQKIEDRGGGEIFLPYTGARYMLTQPVIWNKPECHYRFHFEPGATLVGEFAGPLLQRDVNSPIGGVHEILNGRFEQYHPDGSGVTAHSCVTFKATNCQFLGGGQGGIGIETFNSQCASLDTCTFIGWSKIGISAGNATTALNCDVTGCKEGIRHQNLGLVVLGGRYEVNGMGIHLGMNERGEVFQSTGVKISGLSMESNDHGIYLRSAASVMVDACAITNNTPDKHSGIYMHDAEEVKLVASSVSSGTHPFLDAGIFLNNPKQCSFGALRINVASGKAWRMPEDMTGRNLYFEPSCLPMPEHGKK